MTRQGVEQVTLQDTFRPVEGLRAFRVQRLDRRHPVAAEAEAQAQPFVLVALLVVAQLAGHGQRDQLAQPARQGRLGGLGELDEGAQGAWLMPHAFEKFAKGSKALVPGASTAARPSSNSSNSNRGIRSVMQQGVSR